MESNTILAEFKICILVKNIIVDNVANLNGFSNYFIDHCNIVHGIK